jgi:hypothetical protein
LHENPENHGKCVFTFERNSVFQAQTKSSDPRSRKKQTTKAEKRMKNLAKPLPRKKIAKNHPDSP